MDGVAVTLQPAEEAEGEDADEQTDQRQQDAHPGDDIQQQVVHAVRFLWTDAAREEERSFRAAPLTWWSLRSHNLLAAMKDSHLLPKKHSKHCILKGTVCPKKQNKKI